MGVEVLTASRSMSGERFGKREIEKLSRVWRRSGSSIPHQIDHFLSAVCCSVLSASMCTFLSVCRFVFGVGGFGCPPPPPFLVLFVGGFFPI